MSEIDFPDAEDIASNEVIFEGDAPNNVNTDVVFQPNTLVGLFSVTTPSNGPEWGLTSGGSLTAEAFISVFQKTSTDNNGIMRLKNLEGAAWASLTANGSLTGWSIRTILGDYYGQVESQYPSGGAVGTICSVVSQLTNGRVLFGPFGDDYFLYDCPGDFFSLTGATATVGEIFTRISNVGSGTFETYECISPGTSTTDPATFSGPSESVGTYFTSYTPLTGGAQCEYPFSWSWDQNLQIWKFDCSVTAWLAEGATKINTETPEQGSQGFQGYFGGQGFQGRRGLQGFQGYRGATAADNSVGSVGQIQYKNGTSLSANASSTITTDSSLDPSSGYSGNFLNYSESFKIDPNTYSTGGTINLNFDAYSVYGATQIELGSDKTLTFSGFDTSKTGQSLTLVLGYSGGSNSQIVIPGQENIYWKNGPLGGGGGETSYITPTSTRQNTVFYFLNDGDRIYGSYSTDYRKA
jgi:hypothetical protein